MRSIFTLLMIIMFSAYNATSQTSCGPSGVRTEININADPQTIWKILTDVKKYPDWNPYIYEIKGDIQPGKMVRFRMKGSPKERKFSAKILAFDPGKEWAWGGSIGFLFKARHYFILESIDKDHTKLIQGETWTGWFGKGFGKTVYKDVCENFPKMNEKLKELSEKH